MSQSDEPGGQQRQVWRVGRSEDGPPIYVGTPENPKPPPSGRCTCNRCPTCGGQR